MNVTLSRSLSGLRGLRGGLGSQSDDMIAQYQLALAAGDPLAVSASTWAGNGGSPNTATSATQYLVNIMNAPSYPSGMTAAQAKMMAIAYPTQSNCVANGGTWAGGVCTFPTYGAPPPVPTTPILTQTNPVASGAVATSAANPFSNVLHTFETGAFSGVPYWAIAAAALGALFFMSKKGR